MKQHNGISFFVKSAGILLTVTAAAKMVSSFGTVRIEDKMDPIFSIRFRDLFRIFGAIEMVAAAFCFLSTNRKLQAGLIALLASNFLLYRLGVNWLGYNNFCPCLGHLADALRIPPQVADSALKIMLAYLLFGGYGTLIYLWRAGEKDRPKNLSLPAK
jgi:hypothetical protein